MRRLTRNYAPGCSPHKRWKDKPVEVRLNPVARTVRALRSAVVPARRRPASRSDWKREIKNQIE